MHNRKTALTFEERITAAYLHYVQGVDQHVVAAAFVINPGRVAEACVAIRAAAENPRRFTERSPAASAAVVAALMDGVKDDNPVT